MVNIDVGRQTSPLEGILGIMGGLGQGFEQVRQEREAQNMQALGLLAKNPSFEFAPAGPGEAQLSPFAERLTGAPVYRPTASGMPVVNFNGIPITLRQRPDIFAPQTGAGQPGVPSVPGAVAPVPGVARSGEAIPPTSPLYAGGPVTQEPLQPAKTAKPANSANPAMPRPVPAPGTPEMAQYDATREQYIAQHPQVQDAMRVYSRFRDERSAQQVVDAKLKVGGLFDNLWEKAYGQARDTRNDLQAIRTKYAEAASNIVDPGQREQMLQILANPGLTHEQLVQLLPMIPGLKLQEHEFEMLKQGRSQGFEYEQQQRQQDFQSAQQWRQQNFEAAQQGRSQAHGTAERMGRQEFETTGQPLQGVLAEKAELLKTMRAKVQDAIQLFDPQYVGPLTGRFGSARELLGTAQGKEILLRQVMTDLTDELGRLRTGAAMPRHELDAFERMVGSVRNQPEVLSARLGGFQRAVDQRLHEIVTVASTPRGELMQQHPELGAVVPPRTAREKRATAPSAQLQQTVIPKALAEEALGKLPTHISREQAIENWRKQGVRIGP